jgi:23S rRNA (cytidine1920-2'-O)/16S rRNA (cytidine1409-2'-O)-methyltransferase
MRADQLLVAQGLAPTRSAAQRLIAHGAVRWRTHASAAWSMPRKAGDELPAGCELEVVDDAELRWASRGGLKLDGALAATGLDVRGRTCLDVGQSTGGFTDVLLARGAARVVGVDVGHGQLHPRLRADPRVVALEGVNARHLDAAALGDVLPAGGFGLVVGDLSFISLAHVLPALAPFVARDGDLLLLVKPQFELQPSQLGKGGVVKDAARYAEVRERVEAACRDAGLVVQRWFDSPVRGGDGNAEFFVWTHPARQPQE